MPDHSYTYEDGDGRILGTGTVSNATIVAAMENAGLLIADEVGSPESREPRTAVEFRRRGIQMIEQAARLPRHGCTMMSMALREGVMDMLAEAERLEAEERGAEEHRRDEIIAAVNGMPRMASTFDAPSLGTVTADFLLRPTRPVVRRPSRQSYGAGPFTVAGVPLLVAGASDMAKPKGTRGRRRKR